MIIKFLSLLAKYLWIKELGLLNGLALILAIYVHEYGHYFKAKELNYNPKTPRFIPYLGAYVKTEEIKNANHQFQVSFYGPLVGGIVGIICFYLEIIVDSKFTHQLALYSILLNFFNLLPISILDGGKIVKSLALNRLLVFFNVLVIIFSLMYTKYFFTILGVIGLLFSFITKDYKIVEMSSTDKRKNIQLYVVFTIVLSIHTYLIIK
ncbi:MAG: site-2 protease family protein [Salinimicrobium sp.]